MILYILGRIASLIMILFAVSVIVFSLMHSVPGGPFDERKGRLPAAAKANILKKYGLDQPVWKQYMNYMSHALRFDFGIPYQRPHTTVAKLIGKSWLITVQVGLTTIFFAFSIGIILGIYAAYHQNTWIDNFVTFISSLGVTVPNFVVAMWLILIFAVHYNWVPMGGWGSSGQCLFGKYFCTDWILPVVAYAIAPMSLVARYTRASVVEVMGEEYVRTARAKGLNESKVMRRHVFRNAQIPMITALGTEIPNLITGSIFIESTFRINGLGKYFVTSTLNRDYPMIMATFLLVALLWGIIYLLTDIAYTLIDPRIRLGGSSIN
ncbi:MAG: ABC transporter permease [SAR324 cluster bacterium]|nr:ABC transporter permease [SAR324 cluster bacterium]HCP35051.1 ABC transporter permease [Deltaproteobacteria bacterium]MDP6246927.1 ABC transporter permease [SAR324 cluster bacterium]MDP6463817.1 ABC transporter permease [SAR324 cluster bacterium]MDP7138021.1 ABC transporter permease [SAR324 cluster bacterium]